MLLGSTATSTRCEEKEARNLGEAHWNTEGKILVLKTVINSVTKSQFTLKYFRICKNEQKKVCKNKHSLRMALSYYFKFIVLI